MRAFNTAKLRKQGPLSPHEVAGVKRKVLRSVEALLDAGSGSCILRDPTYAQVVQTSLLHFDASRYHLRGWCIMPNHVHALLQPSQNEDLSNILHSWKSYTGHKLPIVHAGRVWESESFDHIVRSDEHLQRFVRYIEGNSAAAGLRSWPWVSGAEEVSSAAE